MDIANELKKACTYINKVDFLDADSAKRNRVDVVVYGYLAYYFTSHHKFTAITKWLDRLGASYASLMS